MFDAMYHEYSQGNLTAKVLYLECFVLHMYVYSSIYETIVEDTVIAFISSIWC